MMRHHHRVRVGFLINASEFAVQALAIAIVQTRRDPVGKAVVAQGIAVAIAGHELRG